MMRAAIVALGLLIAITAADGATPAEVIYREFRNPPRSYSLMPYWFWNGRITAAETRRQIEQMMSQGVSSAVLFPWDGMEQSYLSEDYFRQVGAALDIAKELGFTLNLADEHDWPSGHAWAPDANSPELSRVLRDHPEFRMRRLEETELAAGAKAPGASEEFAVAGRRDAEGRLDASSLQL